MKRRSFVHAAALAAAWPSIPQAGSGPGPSTARRRLLAFGSGNFAAFLKHIVPFTQKQNPKICLLPTAVGDSLVNITHWYAACEGLPVQPYVLKAFVDSYTATQSFEDKIMAMDAVFVGGGNTLNMLAIWKAQGIDVALRKAYDQGILMTGGSAGSLCWFESGTSDSRPMALSKVDCMGWLKGSHCPHFDAQASRRPLYHELISKGELPPGYACDNLAGVYFEDEKFVKSIALNGKSFSYHVDVAGGKTTETRLATEVLG